MKPFITSASPLCVLFFAATALSETPRTVDSEKLRKAMELQPQVTSPPPKDGFVPKAETAVAIAKAVLKARFGDNAFGTMKFEAMLVGERWVVTDIKHPPKREASYSVGGGYQVELSRKDGTILNILKQR